MSKTSRNDVAMRILSLASAGLVALALQSPAFATDPVVPDTYLLSGTADLEDSKAVFLMARTPTRALMISAKLDHPNVRYYILSDKNLAYPLSIQLNSDIDWKNPSNLHDTNGISVRALLQQKGENDLPVVAGVQAGFMSRLTLALCFGDPNDGHSIPLVNDLIKDSAEHSDSYGTLTVSGQGNPSVIEFKKTQKNQLRRFKDATLESLKSDSFKQGILTHDVSCEFSVPLNRLTDVPWNAKVRSLTVGIAGERDQFSGALHVTEFETDPAKVNAMIDRVISQIPDGTQVVTRANDKLTYQWSDGEVQIAQDTQALTAAEGLTFSPPAPWWKNALWPVIIAIAAVIVAVFWWRKEQRQ